MTGREDELARHERLLDAAVETIRKLALQLLILRLQLHSLVAENNGGTSKDQKKNPF
jgi:hypothetical protein